MPRYTEYIDVEQLAHDLNLEVTIRPSESFIEKVSRSKGATLIGTAILGIITFSMFKTANRVVKNG